MTRSEDVCSTLSGFLTEEGPLILFAGAGVSAHAGLPTWGTYLEQLAEFARIHDPMTRHIMHERLGDGEFLNAAELYFLCKKIPEPEKYHNLVVPLEEYDSSPLTNLVQIPFSAIVTTNYDRSLLDAYASVYGCAAEEVNLDDPTLTAAPFNSHCYVARIHGRVEVPESMRLSERHFEYLDKNTHYLDFLGHLFTRARLLFVGFSFLDPAIRQVFEIVQKRVGKYHAGRHLALLPEDATDDFIRKLEMFSVRKVFYHPENHHEELWQCFNQIRTAETTEKIATTGISSADPFALTKKYLCACYARASLGHRAIPLRKVVVEGIVSSLVASSGDEGILGQKLHKAVAEELALSEKDAAPLVDAASLVLINDGLIRTTSAGLSKTYFFSGDNNEEAYETGLKVLENGIVDRFVVRSAGRDSPEIRKCLRALFDYLISHRGWDLGAAFAGGTVPDQLEIPAMMRTVSQCKTSIGAKDVTNLSRAVDDIIEHPNTSEAEVLAELGRTSFALELTTHTAHDTLFHALTLPERIYLDANVLMPAFTPGHPYQDVYQTTISRLIEAATSALSTVEVVAYRGFLNEIVSHRRLAVNEMAYLDKESITSLRKEALLYGTINMNVYISGYANTLASKNDLTFADYLNLNAPYRTEGELARWFEKRGISVKGDAELKAGTEDLPNIIHILERANADGKWRRKEGALIMHDAVQLAALSRDIKGGKRVVFVSADRRLRSNISNSKISSLANAMISHIGLTQLVDLLVGNPSGGKGLASMLWGAKTSDNTEQIRNYLIDLALNDYDEGYAMEMNEIVDFIAEDAVFELNRQGLHIETDKPKERAKVMKVLESFEDTFFSKMREVIEKIRHDDA